MDQGHSRTTTLLYDANRHDTDPVRTIQGPGNVLLGALPVQDYERLAGELRFTSLGARQSLHKRDEPIERVYFLNEGVCSVTKTMSDGNTIELALIGANGVVGIDAVLGGSRSSCDASMRVRSESAYSLSLDGLRAEMDRRGVFFETIMQYARSFTHLLMQSSACSALHPVKERCARWLLMMLDHLRTDELDTSQETIAMALGVRRPTITLVLNDLVKDGAVVLQRRRIAVNRTALEAVACECYRLMRS